MGAAIMPRPRGRWRAVLAHAESFGAAALRGLRPGRPLRGPARLLRVAIGMIVAALLGHLLHHHDQQVLLCVGAFLAGIGSLIPHHRPRLVAAAGTGLALVLAAALGVVLHGSWLVILPVLLVGLFVGGLLRVVGVGLSMRVIVVTIVFVAFGELTPSLAAGLGEIALFGAGIAIVLLIAVLPPYEARHGMQRTTVAALYDELAGPGPWGAALLAADRSLALSGRDHDATMRRLVHLVERGEEIGQLLALLHTRGVDLDDPWRTTVSDRLRTIARAIRQRRPSSPSTDLAAPDGPGPTAALVAAVNAAARTVTDESVGAPSDERRPPGSVELVRAEIRNDSPILHHAARLAVTGVLAEIVGVALGMWLGPAVVLGGHGFWVLVAVVLILFPDYGETFSRGFGRTVGSVLGAGLGIALSFLPPSAGLQTTLLIVLFLGYLAFRSCGQPYTMFWVVAWIATLSVGPVGAVTRGAETVVGCLLAFLAYLVAPTYQRTRLDRLVAAWARAEAERLRAVDHLAERPDDEAGRLDLARATVRARLARLDLLEAAGQARHEPAHRDGRWSDAAISEASAAVQEIARQSSVLAVLRPEPLDRPDRAMPCPSTELARRLTALADAVTDQAGTAEVPGQTPAMASDPDGQAALDRAVVSLDVLEAAVLAVTPHPCGRPEQPDSNGADASPGQVP